MRNLFLFVVLAVLSTSLNAQTITSSTSFSQADANSQGWPITISGGSLSNPVIITLSENISLSQNFHYFIIASEYVTIDGNNKSITLDNVFNYPGLVQNGTNSLSGYNNVTITKIKLVSNSAGLATEGGWIGQTFFGFNTSSVIISNCSSDGETTNAGGGITGSNSSCTVMNSYSSGELSWDAGGIFGAYSEGTAINCYSTGNMDYYCGGIFGYSSYGSAVDCYSTGNIGTLCGGILGYGANGTANNCYSTGPISNGGGIAGSQNWATIDNCYSTGNIDANSAGITPENYGSISNCYTTGVFLDLSSIGISNNFGPGNSNNCHSEGNGNWDDANALGVLTSTGVLPTWIDIDRPSTATPFKLASFDAVVYDPSSESKPENAVITSPSGNFTTGVYSIVSINDSDPSVYPSITVNSSTGMLTFTNSGPGSFIVKVVYADNSDGSYQVSDYTLTILSVLPLTWRSFTVTTRGNTALLQWSTASEQNTRDFNVQHSTDGSGWMTIGSLPAAGNSSSISSYSYLHADPVTGDNYYRIQQTDMDSRYSYSTIQKMQIASNNKSFSVINTAVSNGILQVAVKIPVVLYLYNNDGKLIWQKEFNTGMQHIDLGTVSTGVYILKGKDTVEKIVVR